MYRDRVAPITGQWTTLWPIHDSDLLTYCITHASNTPSHLHGTSSFNAQPSLFLRFGGCTASLTHGHTAAHHRSLFQPFPCTSQCTRALTHSPSSACRSELDSAMERRVRARWYTAVLNGPHTPHRHIQAPPSQHSRQR